MNKLQHWLLAATAGSVLAVVPAYAQPMSFASADQDGDGHITRLEAEQVGLNALVKNWDQADNDGDGVLGPAEYASPRTAGASSPPGDAGPDRAQQQLDQALVRKVQRVLNDKGYAAGHVDGTWDEDTSKALRNFQERQGLPVSGDLSEQTLAALGIAGTGQTGEPAQSQSAGADGKSRAAQQQAEAAGGKPGAKGAGGTGGAAESEHQGKDKPDPRPGGKQSPATVIGKGKFQAPETAIWDEQADVYLVSNINGKLTALDDNGFISRVAPDGTIIDLKWIKADKNPAVVLHGPKGMLLTDRFLVVADVNAVRIFERATGDPLRSIVMPGSYMLNDLTIGPDGTLYVTDTGDKLSKHPGKVYRIATGEEPVLVARGSELDRPDGVLWHEDGLLIAPFAAHADTLYHLSLDGQRLPFATVPKPQLDGLLRLPDGSFIVTSWKGNSVYRLREGDKAETVIDDIATPAQIGYDAKRQRLLIPVLKENKLIFYPMQAGTKQGRGGGS